MDVEIIRERVRAGSYLIKSHAVQHALKEGFERKHMVDTVLDGTLIEDKGCFYAAKQIYRKALTSTCTLFANTRIQFTLS